MNVQLLRMLMLRLTYNKYCIKYLRHIKFSEINKCTSLSTICIREKSLGAVRVNTKSKNIWYSRSRNSLGIMRGAYYSPFPFDLHM